MHPLLQEAASEYSPLQITDNNYSTTNTANSTAYSNSNSNINNKNLVVNVPRYDFVDDYSRTEYEPKTVNSPLVHRISAGVLSSNNNNNNSNMNNNYQSTSTNSSFVAAANVKHLKASSKEKEELLVYSGQEQTRKYTKAELNARTPWKVFFTHPVALVLLTGSFGFVSKPLHIAYTVNCSFYSYLYEDDQRAITLL